jgi:hypothetical protein
MTKGEPVTDFYVLADANPQVDEEGRDFIQLAEQASTIDQIRAFEESEEFQEAAQVAILMRRPVGLWKLTYVRKFGEENEDD